MLDKSYEAVPYLEQIPREVRQQIFHYCIFQTAELDTLKDASTAVVPVNVNHVTRLSIHVAVLATCRKFKEEGEYVLFSCLLGDLDPEPTGQISHQLTYPNSSNSLFRQVRYFRYTVNPDIHLCDIKNNTIELLRSLPLLRVLEYIYRPQTNDITIALDTEWFRTLPGYDGVINLHIIYPDGSQEYQSLCKPTDGIEGRQCIEAMGNQAPKSKLPRGHPPLFSKLCAEGKRHIWKSIWKQIIREVALPLNNIIHPLLARAVEPETVNILPLLLTCREIKKLTAAVVYGEATFMCCDSHTCRKFKQVVHSWKVKPTSIEINCRAWLENGLIFSKVFPEWELGKLSSCSCIWAIEAMQVLWK